MSGWTKDKVEEAFNQWLLTQGRASSKLTTQSDRINAMDVNEAIRISVMDILYANGSDAELNNKFADAVKRLAVEMEVKPQRTNETTLFREKENVLSVGSIKLIGN
jgi:hypothetical protein